MTHLCLGAMHVSFRVALVHDSLDSSTKSISCHGFAGSPLPCRIITTSPILLPLSYPGDVSLRLPLLFSPRGHKPSPTLHDRLISHLPLLPTPSLSIPLLYTKPSGVVLSAIVPLFPTSHSVLSVLHNQGFRT